MQLQVGDKFTDEFGEREVIAHPYATAGGKGTNVRLQRVTSNNAAKVLARPITVTFSVIVISGGSLAASLPV